MDREEAAKMRELEAQVERFKRREREAVEIFENWLWCSDSHFGPKTATRQWLSEVRP